MEFYCEERLGGYVIGQPDPGTHLPTMWSFLIELLGLKSMIDIGCGEGHTAKFFKDKGLAVLGIEGCKKAIEETVIPGDVVCHDFYDGPYTYLSDFDLAWCAEVVEHIDEEHIDNLVKTIGVHAFAKYVAVTHAIPGQGGHHHVNCQPTSYWQNLFGEYHYVLDKDLTEKARMLSDLERGPNHFGKSGLIFRQD